MLVLIGGHAQPCLGCNTLGLAELWLVFQVFFLVFFFYFLAIPAWEAVGVPSIIDQIQGWKLEHSVGTEHLWPHTEKTALTANSVWKETGKFISNSVWGPLVWKINREFMGSGISCVRNLKSLVKIWKAVRLWVFLYPDDDIVFCIALPGLAHALLSAVQWFSCVKLISTSPWQSSPTKWTSGSHNTHWIYKHVCALAITHNLTDLSKCSDIHTIWERLQFCLEQRGRWFTVVRCQHWQSGKSVHFLSEHIWVYILLHASEVGFTGAFKSV